jgi:GNAT superfamily N-acetyltransferase
VLNVQPLHADMCRPVARFLRECREEETARDSRLWLSPRLETGIYERLINHLQDRDERLWAVCDERDELVGVLGARAKELPPYDSRRTYLPAIYGMLPVVTMGIRAGCWAEVLPLLWKAASAWLQERQVRQPQVWLNTCNDEAFEAWRNLGFTWLMDNALRPLSPEDVRRTDPPPGVIVRPASLRDTSKIVPLYMEELEFHVRLPGGFWTPTDNQTPSLARREIEGFIAAGADYIYFVAERISDGQLLGYINSTSAPPLPDNPNLLFFPPDRGVLQVGVVTESLRGAGIGRALLEHTLAWFYRRGMRSVGLSYDVRNPLSGPFWRKNGFVPLRRALICTEF